MAIEQQEQRVASRTHSDAAGIDNMTEQHDRHDATTHEYLLNRIDALHEKVDRNAEAASADNKKLLYTIIGAGIALFVSVIGAAAAIAAAIISSGG